MKKAGARIRRVLTTPPRLDEIEVSLIGPAYGECIIVHVGNGEWIVVDSCLDKDQNKPAVLHYFDTIGVDTSNAVRLVVATHWHDDHIKGLSKILEACPNAEFVCTPLMRERDFLSFVITAGRNQLTTIGSGTHEFYSILQILKDRGVTSRTTLTPKWAMEDRLLWRRLRKEFNVHIYSLSPSDASFSKALQAMSEWISSLATPTTSRTPKRRIRSPQPKKNPSCHTQEGFYQKK